MTTRYRFRPCDVVKEMLASGRWATLANGGYVHEDGTIIKKVNFDWTINGKGRFKTLNLARWDYENYLATGRKSYPNW
mgnify:CR=1 FL=1